MSLHRLLGSVLGAALAAAVGCEPEPVPCDVGFDAVFRYADGNGWDDLVSIAGAGDTNGDGYDDVLIGDAMRREQAGAVHLFLGPLEGELFLEDADVIFEGVSHYDRAGEAVAGAGDVDGDGYADVLIAARSATIDLDEQGIVSLMRGPFEPGKVSLIGADARLYGHRDGDRVGSSLAGVGDLDGDGRDDFLIGAVSASPGGSSPGISYVVYGPIDGDLDLGDADAELRGEEHLDRAGDAVCPAGDLDGDGHPDLMVGARGQDALGHKSGAAYVQTGPVEGFVDLELADLRLLGPSGSEAGSAVAGGGDLDGDGFGDVAVGAAYTAGGGSVYVVRGPVEGSKELSDVGQLLAGVSYTGGIDDIGEALAIPGDMTGDGLADLVVGAPGVWDVAYLVHGPVDCQGVIAEECGATNLKGEEHAWSMGELVAPAGDVNGDGYPDVLVGAPMEDHDDSMIYWPGAVYLFYGGPCL